MRRARRGLAWIATAWLLAVLLAMIGLAVHARHQGAVRGTAVALRVHRGRQLAVSALAEAFARVAVLADDPSARLAAAGPGTWYELVRGAGGPRVDGGWVEPVRTAALAAAGRFDISKVMVRRVASVEKDGLLQGVLEATVSVVDPRGRGWRVRERRAYYMQAVAGEPQLWVSSRCVLLQVPLGRDHVGI